MKFIAALFLAMLCALPAYLQTSQRDGQKDFDFEIGTWKTKLKRLEKPLSGSTKWLEYEGTTVVRKVWNGRANLVELVAEGPAGKFEGLSLRLYDPQTRQWSLNFASSRGGGMAMATIGEFKNGRGEFYSHETYNGRHLGHQARLGPLRTGVFRRRLQNVGGKLDRRRYSSKKLREGVS